MSIPAIVFPKLSNRTKNLDTPYLMLPWYKFKLNIVGTQVSTHNFTFAWINQRYFFHKIFLDIRICIYILLTLHRYLDWTHVSCCQYIVLIFSIKLGLTKKVCLIFLLTHSHFNMSPRSVWISIPSNMIRFTYIFGW